MKKYMLLAFIILSSFAFAETDKIILVSDTTSVDMLIAKAASEKTGIPMLILAGGMVNDSIKSELSFLRVRTVILVGGPVVITPEAEANLSSYTVVRLWGFERTGTAVEVAKYFWQEGSSCVVISDDTKDSESDTEIQLIASEVAVNNNCPFVPVPKGKMTADVVDLIQDLNVTNAVFVGYSSSAEFRSRLSNLNLREITGGKTEIEEMAEKEIKDKAASSNSTLNLIIVAAPHWKHVLGYAAHPQRGTLVKIVSNVDSATNLAAFIKTNNIGNVSVVGFPPLANDIAAELEAQGITVKKISGEPGENAINSLRANIERWEERRRDAARNETASRTKIRPRLLSLTNALEIKLNNLEKEIGELNNSNADQRTVMIIRNKIRASKTQLSAIRDYIDKGNEELAKIRIVKILNDVTLMRWIYRTELRVNVEQDLRSEES